MARDRTDALFMAPGVFFGSRHVLIATLAARDRIPSAGVARNDAAAGMLMSYGPDLTKMYHQLGVYTGNILKGAKPADLPVVQSVWSSTCKPRGCSASRCRQICSLSQTR
jgi:putative tryptophan/tyrosine transport system substrate-binding protein